MYEPVIDWGDPKCRLGLIEMVGIDEYNRLFAEHRKRLALGIRSTNIMPHPKLSIVKRIRAARNPRSTQQESPGRESGARFQSRERTARSSPHGPWTL
jgi:hypothetical protein